MIRARRACETEKQLIFTENYENTPGMILDKDRNNQEALRVNLYVQSCTEMFISSILIQHINFNVTLVFY